MIRGLVAFIILCLCIQSAPAQDGAQKSTPSLPLPSLPDDSQSVQQSPSIPGVPQPDEFGEENSGLVIKKNSFTYDGNEGRDPFKIFREIPIIIGNQNPNDGKDVAKPIPTFSEKNIRTAIIPNEVTVLGILYKKVDPIALISVKGVKGLNKLKVNSPIGRNDGKIIEIKKDQVVIEQIKDFDGQKFTEKIVLKVRQRKD